MGRCRGEATRRWWTPSLMGARGMDRLMPRGQSQREPRRSGSRHARPPRERAGHGAHGRQPTSHCSRCSGATSLHAALKAYGPFHLVRVVPQIALLSLAEFIVAVVARHRDRASAVAQAWRWNFVNRRTLRTERAAVRRIDDSTTPRSVECSCTAALDSTPMYDAPSPMPGGREPRCGPPRHRADFL